MQQYVHIPKQTDFIYGYDHIRGCLEDGLVHACTCLLSRHVHEPSSIQDYYFYKTCSFTLSTCLRAILYLLTFYSDDFIKFL